MRKEEDMAIQFRENDGEWKVILDGEEAKGNYNFCDKLCPVLKPCAKIFQTLNSNVSSLPWASEVISEIF